MMSKLVKQFFTDKHGDVVLWQKPNPPIVGWLLLSILALLVTNEPLRTTISFFGSAFLFVWAYLELTSGASYFRRSLGALVIVLMVISRLF